MDRHLVNPLVDAGFSPAEMQPLGSHDLLLVHNGNLADLHVVIFWSERRVASVAESTKSHKSSI